MSLAFCALLGVSITAPRSANAGGGGNGMGVMGTLLGGGLVMVGVYGLTKDLPVATSCTANCAPAWGKVGVDLLEIAGGAVALSAAMQNESETRAPGGMPNFSSSSSTPGGGGGGGNNFDLCAQMPSHICGFNPDTNRPQLALPPKSTMREALTKSFHGKSVNPDGLSLDEALTDLDNKYDQASDAIAAFNSASNSGAFDSALDGDSALAGTGQGDGDAADGEGLNKGRGLTGSGGGGHEAFTLPNGESTDWASLLNKTKAARGPLAGAKATGLNLEDARSGRVLNIWERVSRAIRGTRDRDILLAKVEWTRKLALKNQEKIGTKKPNFAVSTEKN